MMLVDFPGSNLTLHKPDTMTDEQCSSARVFHGVDDSGFPFYLACFQPSKEDIDAINAGRGIFFRILTNDGMPPICAFTLDGKDDLNV